MAEPTTWYGVAGNAISDYIAMLANAPLVLHFGLIFLVVFVFLGWLGYKYFIKRLEYKIAEQTHAQSNVTQGVPIEALTAIINEASQQTTTSARAVSELSDHVKSMVEHLGAMGQSITQMSETVDDLHELIRNGNAVSNSGVCPYARDSSIPHTPRRRSSDLDQDQ